MRYLRFPAYGDNGQRDNVNTAMYYTSREPGPKPLVIVLPVWGISEYPSNQVTGDVLRESAGDINVFAMEGDNYLIDWRAMADARTELEFVQLADEMAERIRTMVIDIRRIVDWAQEQPEVDRERIALIGFSLSAVVGSLTVAHEPRLDATVLVMGAANPAEIFTVCAGRPGMVRRAVGKRFDWTLDEYQDIFARAFLHGDARRYAGRVDPERLLVIDAHHDDCMTQEARDALWNAMGRPERVSFRYTHRLSFLALSPLGQNAMVKRIYSFFEEQLLEQ